MNILGASWEHLQREREGERGRDFLNVAAWQALGPTLAAILLEALRAPLADADAEIAPRAEIIGGPRKGPTNRAI